MIDDATVVMLTNAKISLLKKPFAQAVLYALTRKVISPNKAFENLHFGKSCYIFGNGASIKEFDLKAFSDKISLGLGAIVAHRDVGCIDLRYVYEGHPFFFYPYWINPYTKKIERNILGDFYKKHWSKKPSITYFVSLSNYFGVRGSNVYYAHHFEKVFSNYTTCRLDKTFTSMASGLTAVLGIALYMGFIDITLVGCDYTFYPQGQGHFYEYGRFSDSFQEVPINACMLEDAMKQSRIQTVIPSKKYRGHMVPHRVYGDLTSERNEYKENNLLLDRVDLEALNSSGMPYRIFEKSRLE